MLSRVEPRSFLVYLPSETRDVRALFETSRSVKIGNWSISEPIMVNGTGFVLVEIFTFTTMIINYLILFLTYWVTSGALVSN